MRFTKSGPARAESQENSQPTQQPQENFGISALTRCLVDAEGNTGVGAGRARRKALGVSALIQFCTLTALLIVPLFATGSRLILRPTNFVPLPPYGGVPKQAGANTQQVQAPPTKHPTGDFFPVVTQIQVPTRPQKDNTAIEDLDLKSGTSTALNSDGFRDGSGSGGEKNILSGYSTSPGPQPPRPEVPTTLPPRKPITVSQGVQLALLTHRVEPIYPNFARQAHREGTVELRAIISTDGVVKDIQVLSGDPVLAHAARDAVTQWRFRPTLLNGVAVEVITFVTVKFHIDQ